MHSTLNIQCKELQWYIFIVHKNLEINFIFLKQLVK